MKKIERDRLMIMVREGWAERRRTGGHIVWWHPVYGMMTTSSTPSDRNALRQIERQLRRIRLAHSC
jgi:predicted RNA binding protein YcfA (HicA-like mRNA interferase family)